MRKKHLKAVFLDTVPVLTGYLFLGMGFGILLTESGYGVLWALAMSIFVFAGSGQYLAVSLLANSSGLLSAAIATLLVNARHLFYGISLLEKYKGTGKKKPYLIFALTDETYSLVTQNEPPEGMSRHSYCFTVSVLDHIYWITGCTLGALVGQFIPINYEGIEFVLTALFVTMFVDRWLTNKDHFPAMVGVCATFVSLLLFGSEFFLIPAMVLIALLLTLSPKTGRRDSNA
ncbi:MAG: AzlC family ABC transporter permease [Oscillospiraceae bacterium]|nr:AzlC family ABC transporter permease [Oscillospiraceae bacterium]